MNRRGGIALWTSIILVVVLVISLFLYFILFTPGNDSYYENLIASGELKNPVEGLNSTQAADQFDKSYIYFLLVSMKAYNLHNPPLSKDNPKIEVIVSDDTTYGGIIKDGKISVETGEINNEDIRVYTTKEEITSILHDQSYVTSSFTSGKSKIELVADKTTLFSKGYLNLYNDLTGKTITGGVIGIYTG